MPAFFRGMIAFTLIQTDEQHHQLPKRDEWEVALDTQILKVPLNTFLDGPKFNQWIGAQASKGFLLGQDVLSARSLYLMNTPRAQNSTQEQKRNSNKLQPISEWFNSLIQRLQSVFGMRPKPNQSQK